MPAAADRGLILGMHILFRALGLEGKRVAQSQSYEPTSRGGFCYSDLIVTDDPSDYPLVTGLDMIAGLSQVGLDRSLALVKPNALVIVDERLVAEPPNGFSRLHVLPISQRAIALGSPRIANIITLGALARLTEVCSKDSLETAVRLETPKKFADLNLAAVQEGFALAAGSRSSGEARTVMQAFAG